MPPRVSRGLLDSVLSSVDATLSDRRRLADVVLMVALADSFVSDEELERISEAIAAYGELVGVDFDYIYGRIEELQLTAPLFSEEREQLVREMSNPRAGRLALTLAAKLVGDGRTLAEEERALLDGLADAFKIPEAERPSLFSPWAPGPSFADSSSFRRCAFNSPERIEKKAFFDAMAATENDVEFRMLADKVSATRHLMTKLFEDGEVLGVGEMIRVGPYAFHADAIIEHTLATQQTVGYRRYITRFLAAGEALHALEHSVLSALSHRLDESARIMIVHTGDLSSQDRIFLQGFDPNVLRGEQLGV